MSGVQSILTTDREKYSTQAIQNLSVMSDAYFYKKKFLLGEGVDRDKMRHYKRIEKIMCSEVCEIITYIKKKLEGQLEGCEYYRTFGEVFEQHNNTHGNTYNITQVIKEEFSWNSTEW
jgi:hypothetical protein